MKIRSKWLSKSAIIMAFFVYNLVICVPTNGDDKSAVAKLSPFCIQEMESLAKVTAQKNLTLSGQPKSKKEFALTQIRAAVKIANGEAPSDDPGNAKAIRGILEKFEI